MCEADGRQRKATPQFRRCDSADGCRDQRLAAEPVASLSMALSRNHDKLTLSNKANINQSGY